jgi:hypothetical protein
VDVAVMVLFAVKHITGTDKLTVGAAKTLAIFTELVAVQPLVLETVIEYVPAVFIVVLAVAAPLDQLNIVPVVFAVSVTGTEQGNTDVVILNVGVALIVTVLVAVQKLVPDVTVTVYVPGVETGNIPVEFEMLPGLIL